MDDAKIEEYLEKQGIRSMQDHGIKKPLIPKRKKAPLKKRQFKRPRDNEHLADILETYEGLKETLCLLTFQMLINVLNHFADNTITQKGDLQQNKLQS